MSFICVNNGYYNTKIITQDNKQHCFRTAIQKSLTEYDKNVVELNGERYIVGSGKHDLKLDKSTSKVQEACVKYAMERYGQQGGKPVDTIVSAIPIDVYLQPEARKAYEDLLNKYAKDVKITMETKIATVNNRDYYKGKTVILVDIGGLTANSMVLVDGRLEEGTAISTQCGTLIFNQALKKHIEQTQLVKVTDAEIDIEDISNYPQIVENHIELLKEEFRKQGYPNRSTVHHRFIGGGALKFKSFLEKSFPNCFIPEDAEWENAKGIYTIARNLANKNKI